MAGPDWNRAIANIAKECQIELGSGGSSMTSLNRRRFVLSAAAATLSALPAAAQSGTTFSYRGFTVDTTSAQGLPNLKEIVASLKHQIDIVADCGAKANILAFFKNQEVFVKPGQGDGGGHFSAKSQGVTVDAAVVAPQKPVLLHELLHAYHFRVLPGAMQNPDVQHFYDNARQGELYPPDAYVLKNVQEFFAVTASLYLWGNVDRPPFNRANLRDKQPVYYRWLGDLFGVQKNA
jgi:hypothetical protein